MDNRNKIVDKLLKSHLDDVEGYSSTTYKDQKGIPTVGAGISLRSPSSKKAFEEMGVDPNVDEMDKFTLDEAQQNIFDQKRELLGNIKQKYFPEKQLNEAQEASLLSLTYNSPELIGPNLRQYLNEGKDLDVMREIVLGSNKEKSPGLLVRRLKEAELYGGPLDFQNLLKVLSPEEKANIYNMLQKLEDPQHKQKVLERYQQFAPDYKAPMEPVKFMNLNKLIKG